MVQNQIVSRGIADAQVPTVTWAVLPEQIGDEALAESA